MTITITACAVVQVPLEQHLQEQAPLSHFKQHQRKKPLSGHWQSTQGSDSSSYSDFPCTCAQNLLQSESSYVCLHSDLADAEVKDINFYCKILLRTLVVGPAEWDVCLPKI